MIKLLIFLSSMLMLFKYSRSLSSNSIYNIVHHHHQHHYHNYFHVNKSYIKRSIVRSLSLKGGSTNIDSGNDSKVLLLQLLLLLLLLLLLSPLVRLLILIFIIIIILIIIIYKASYTSRIYVRRRC